MPDDPALSPDERAAIRAYLQRVEVRLSTLHRVATALLSGAGLVVLLPSIERDSVVVVLRSLLRDVSAANGLLATAVVVVVALPLAALWLLLRELTRFYFHAQHVTTAPSGDGATASVFVPRFTLTGLRLPGGELGPGSAAALDAERSSPANVELLVPAKAPTRARIDRQLGAYEGLGSTDASGERTDDARADAARALGLSQLVASRDRTLLEEVAKVEYGLVRHLLRLQAIVLRYVKALLAFVTTAVAVFAAAAIVGDAEPPGPAAQVALGIVVMVWAPCIVVAVASPVRWVEQLLRSEGATRASVSRDPELTQVEQLAIRVAALGWLVAAAATVMVVVDAGSSVIAPSTTARVAGAAAVAVTGVVHLAVTWSWLGRHRASPRPAA